MASRTDAAATRDLVMPLSLLLHVTTCFHPKNRSDATNTTSLSQGSDTAVATYQSCLILSQKTGVSSFEEIERHSDEDTTRVGPST